MARSCGQWWNLGAIGLLAAAAGAIGLAGCSAEAKPVSAETSKYRPKDSQPGEAAAVKTEQQRIQSDIGTGKGTAPAVAVDPKTGKAPEAAVGGAPPAGELQQLLAYIDKLAKQAEQPPGANQQEMVQNFLKLHQQRMAACEQAMTLKPDAATRGTLAQAMFEIHRIFARVGIPNAKENMAAFVRTLVADPDPEISRFGRYAKFDLTVSQLTSQPLTEGKPVLEEIKALLDAEKGQLSPDTLELARQAVGQLMESGLQADGAAALEMLAVAAEGDPKMADKAANLRDSAKLVKADLGTLLQDLLTDQPDADKKLLTAVQKLLGEVQPTQEVFENLQQIAQIMEATGHAEPAKQCFAEFEKAYKDAKDPELAKNVTEAVAAARTRLSLIGQPFAVEGVTVDGKPFDWAAYQGKVVLIDFWATWCMPCLKEIPNIRSNFDLFHAKGFEVVGVNLDTDVKTVKEFFALQGELPWTTVMSPEALDGKLDANAWPQLPMAAKSGVKAIPFLVLVGKDGKVDSLHVRGPKLKARLTALLGAPPLTEIPADPTAPAGPPAAAPAPAVPAPAVPAPAAPAAPAPPAGKTGQVSPRGALSPVALLVAQALLTADPPADQPAATPAAEDPAINPYKAKPGQSSTQLIEYVLKMLDKPKTIQTRAGFGDAVVEACDRVLKADPPAKETEQLVAAESKFSVLHREACNGNDAADKQLQAFVEELKSDARPRIAREVAFYQLERKAIDAANLPLDQVPAVIKELQDYLAKEKLVGKHLRLASTTVALINRLESGDEREKHFVSFGGTFAKSSDKELARYGKKLAKKPAAQESDLVGKPLELDGTTAKGLPFAWEGYRGKVVIVDFWATWCGPCRREMPNVKAFFEKHKEKGFEVVGVSLDQDQEALATYIEENQLPWETLAGDTQPLAEKYGVRAIPTMMLVDKTGKIVGVAHNLAALTPMAEKLLNGEAIAAPAGK